MRLVLYAIRKYHVLHFLFFYCFLISHHRLFSRWLALFRCCEICLNIRRRWCKKLWQFYLLFNFLIICFHLGYAYVIITTCCRIILREKLLFRINSSSHCTFFCCSWSESSNTTASSCILIPRCTDSC